MISEVLSYISNSMGWLEKISFGIIFIHSREVIMGVAENLLQGPATYKKM